MLNILTKTVIQKFEQQNMANSNSNSFETIQMTDEEIHDDLEDGSDVVISEDDDNIDENIICNEYVFNAENKIVVRDDANSGNIYELKNVCLTSSIDYGILHDQITEIFKNETLQSVGLGVLCNTLGFPNDVKLLSKNDKNVIISLAGVISNYIQILFDSGKHRISVTGGGLPFICHLIGWLQMKIILSVDQNVYYLYVNYNVSYAIILNKIINSVTFFGSKTFEEIEHLLKDKTVFTRLSLRKAGAITISTKRDNKIIHMRYSHVKNTLMSLTSYSEEVTNAVSTNKSQTVVELDNILESFDKIIGETVTRYLYCSF